MVSNTLCPAIHILGSQNRYSRAEGIADRYWPLPVFLMIILSFEVRYASDNSPYSKYYLNDTVNENI